MSKLIIKEKTNIHNMIYEINGKQVILDRDLAKLYEIETKVLIQNVKRNIERFPSDFMFQLTSKETEQIMRCKNFTSSFLCSAFH